MGNLERFEKSTGTSLAYTANALNQYSTITETEAFTSTYDADGNATLVKTATGTWSISYNGENRPVRFENAGTQTGTAVPENPLQWSSEICDSELDLVYYNYRHYSPSLGRFLSRDPIEEQGGLNLYCFVGNMLIKFIDYLGLAFRDETLWYRQNESIFSGPGFWDQVNLKWFPRSEDPEDYTAWFSKRFPKTIAGAKKDLIDRILNYIKENLCSTNSKTFDINALGKMNDIDVAPDMRRYGDVPQNIYERFICIGNFELKVKNINIEWTEEQKFSFTATMYVWEQTGVSPNEGEYGSCLSPFFKKRHIEMGTWSISGNGDCCEN